MNPFRYRCFRGNHQLRIVLDGGEYFSWSLMEFHQKHISGLFQTVAVRRPNATIRDWFAQRGLDVDSCWRVESPSTSNMLIDWVITITFPSKQAAVEFKLLFG